MPVTVRQSIAAKRTAATHLLFNVVTAVIVTIFIGYILQFVKFFTVALVGSFDETVGLALFHTLFSVLGAIIFVPFTKQFSMLLLKLLPEKANALTRNLDDQLVSIPSAALEVAYQTLLQIMKQLTDAILELLDAKKVTSSFEKKVRDVEEAILSVRKFLNEVQSDSTKLRNQHVAIIHVLDHITRLVSVLREQQKVEGIFHHEKLMKKWHKTLEQINESYASEEKLIEMEQVLEKTAQKIAEERRVRRRKYYERTAVRETKLEVAMSNVQALLWIDRLVYHYWRAFARLVEFKKGTEIEES
ncbi:Na/Pi cotransporter family protein [Anoxybacillus kestanbolensis]|uniref:Na/Pi cotransporter family protein n=1 Tax=Anoxybacillus kestanbolensis TaxID=227476 RepID=UPI0018E9CFC6|nr:Na/Pi cotransporter family protein [Anoxybacillus kestanbolensis]